MRRFQRHQAAHGRRDRAFKHDLASPAYRPRRRQPARPDHGRGLWHVDADQPGGDRHGAGAAHDLGVRSGTSRWSAPSTAPSANPISASIRSSRARRCAIPLPELNERAPQGAGQDRAQICRAGAGRGPPCPPRRHGHLKKAEKDGDMSQDEQPRRVRPGPEDDRRDDQRRSTACLPTRKRKSCRFERVGSAQCRRPRKLSAMANARAMSRSSWTATALGARRAACRAPRATARASKPCAGRCARPRDLGIPYLTVYAFSSENWSRPKAEVSDLWVC